MTGLLQLGINYGIYESTFIENHIRDHRSVILSLILSQGPFIGVFTIDFFFKLLFLIIVLPYLLLWSETWTQINSLVFFSVPS